MKSSWRKVSVEEIGAIITGRTPKTINQENFGGFVPFLTPSDDMSRKKSGQTKRTLSAKGLSEVSRCLLPEKSVCVSCIGSDLGKVVLTSEKVVTNQQINSIVTNDDFDPDFIYYAMCLLGKSLNHISKTSTAVPIINKTAFSSFSIIAPDVIEQKKIAAILSAIDDKIELNNRINSNLEQQCDALFLKMFSEIEATTKLSDIAEITMGQSPSGDSYNELGEGTVFYQGRAEFGWRFPTRRLFTTEPRRLARENDILMSVRAPVGDLNVANESCCIGRGLAAMHGDRPSYIYYLLRSCKQTLDSYNGEGTVFGAINKKALAELSVPNPSKEDIAQYEDFAAPMDALVSNNDKENRCLIELRDSLLPKLMSGEIDVSEISALLIYE